MRDKSNARVFVIESDGLMAGNFLRMLGELGYDVAGVAADAHDAFEQLATARPDIVLMDSATGEGNDEAAARIRMRSDLAVVLVAANDDTASAQFVSRTCSKRELHAAIEFALYRHAHDARLRKMADSVLEALNYVDHPIFMADDRGNLVFINRPAKQMLEEAGASADGAMGPPLSGLPTNGRHIPRGMDALSKREMEVLNWFLRGFGTTTIGVRLHVSPQTVRNHLKNVCKKLDVRSQIELRELFAQGA